MPEVWQHGRGEGSCELAIVFGGKAEEKGFRIEVRFWLGKFLNAMLG